jgi:YD repeat-containing protein
LRWPTPTTPSVTRRSLTQQQTAGNGVVTTQSFDAVTGRLTAITAGPSGAVQSHGYTYDLLGKLLTRTDANTSLSKSFGYDSLNRLTSSTVSLSPTPLVKTFSYNAIGNLTGKAFPNFRTDPGHLLGGTAASAIVGGLASVAGGGKFENGAVTAAFGYLFNAARGAAIGGNVTAIAFGLAGAWTGPLDPVLILTGRIVGGIVGSAIEDWAFQENAPSEGRKLPDDRIIGPPRERGLAPVGDDGSPVELHHRGQRQDSPLDEMTRTEHRGPGNFGANHDNTGQSPSQIDRELFNTERRSYWSREWDSGRFERFFQK